MIYEWQCKCGAKVEVTRKLDDYDVPPTTVEGKGQHEGTKHTAVWSKVYTSSTNWETLRDTGVFERLEKYT